MFPHRLLQLIRGLVVLLVLADCQADSRPQESARSSSRSSSSSAEPTERISGKLELTTLEGHSRTLDDFRPDSALVVNFWATWCGPCRRELQEFADFHQRVGDAGIQVIGITLEDTPAPKVRTFASDRGVEYPLLRATQSWARKHFDMHGLPTTVILTPDWKVHQRLIGPQTQESLRQALP